MTADEFFWWYIERNCGLTEQAVRSDPAMAAAVEQELAGRTPQIVGRVMDALRRGEGSDAHQKAAVAGLTGAPPDVENGPHGGQKRVRSAGEGLTAAEAARLLGCSPSKVYRLFDAGELHGHRVGDKRVIDAASIDEYKARHANGSRPSAAAPPPKSTGFRHLKLPRK